MRTLSLPRRSLLAALVVVALAIGAGTAEATGSPAGPSVGATRQFLSLAEAGIVLAKRYWWNPALGWYDERLSNKWNARRPLARLWDAFPLFETIDAVALADPTAANKAAVRSFAAGAERYFNRTLEPVGGYAYYPGTENPLEHTYFDDNGWWALAFVDAYRATGSTRYLTDAERAFRFIAVSGWNPDGGGVWWETLHRHETSEPLAAEIYVGLALYQATRDPSYLHTATTFLAWANAHSWNAALGLYSRNATDPTVLDYVEGMMIGSYSELCTITGEGADCRKAEQLARASIAAFPHDADWTPAADAIYLRFMLDLYASDGNTTWYRLAYDNAERALADGHGTSGLFLRKWNGVTVPGGRLQIDAATLSLFSWLAVAGSHR